MIDDILKHTNMHIDQLRVDHQYSRDRGCKNINKNEFMAYLGLLYLIGINKSHHANVKEIFSSDGTGIQITRVVMSYKRFLLIIRCLRFDDKNTRIERRKVDKLVGIRDFFQAFVNNCKLLFNLSEYTTIDEMLHPFKDRCSFIQYIPSKPAKYRLKIFALCDAKSFYTSILEIYCGKQPDGQLDNWQTKARLLNPLFFVGFQKDKMLVSYVPRKNKSVILLSTLHDDSEMDSDTKKPQVILVYNETKGGVDTVDKMCAAYSVSRITRRWPCVLFYTLMNIGDINAQILYKFACPVKAPKHRRVFLKNLALSLMKEHLIFRSNLRHLPQDISAFLKVNYGRGVEPITEEEKRNPTKNTVCIGHVHWRRKDPQHQ
ncbi:piggyBac transposable element-derived protein 4-like [Colletes gigas]|uniref:piggyBac transposable element-derived protein 4-like n=1 Tax=Colletes gigas TaxID=935657 RepID=UPI001C9A42D0|nr:piggyBac transposable element-derived protein 4-like [Colletes gigas]